MKAVLTLFFVAVAVASSFDPKTCVFTNDKGEKFDYSALSKTDLEYTSDARYHLRLCGPAPSCKAISSTASVCQETVSKDIFDLGEYPTQAVNELADNPSAGTLFIYSGGTSCKNGPERRTNVILRCAADVDGRISSVYEDNCEYFFYVDSKHACPESSPDDGSSSNDNDNSESSGNNDDNNEKNKKSSGLSAGSIILIIFFSCVSAYLIVGTIYNFKFNNKTGISMIPNIEFWTDLPSLCKDGFFFLIGGCQKPVTEGGYDTV